MPDVSDVTVTEIKAVNGGFQVAFADAEPVAARNVVVATGVLPHFHIPAELSGLPPELLSHTADHHRFDRFQGRRVAVVGAGSSALETAALLHEAGGEVQLVVRCPDSPVWGTEGAAADPAEPAPEQQALRRVEVPALEFPDRLPPAAARRPGHKARTVLGPLGAWWLKDRVEGVIEILGKTHVRGAEPSGSGVRLLLDGPTRSSLEVDHVIAGTGFRIDLARLSYLPEDLRTRIATLDGYPVLTGPANRPFPACTSPEPRRPSASARRCDSSPARTICPPS